MTYGEIFEQFCKKFDLSVQVEDYRPAFGLYIDGLDDCTNIPNAIVVWLKDGAKIIYIAER